MSLLSMVTVVVLFSPFFCFISALSPLSKVFGAAMCCVDVSEAAKWLWVSFLTVLSFGFAISPLTWRCGIYSSARFIDHIFDHFFSELSIGDGLVW